ncbi:MAG: HDIG domain-containing protein [Candidatus Omnitrophica bacterium]|nr:HDIG domain-containing protein [Candidatus Omnitrophota bacterium]
MFKLKEMYKSRVFYSSLIVAGFCMATFAILYVGSAPSFSRLKEADISMRTIYAPYDFTYPTEIDKEETENSRIEFEARIPSVLDIDSSVQDAAFADLDNFFNKVKETSRIPDLDEKEKTEALEAKVDFELSNKDATIFLQLKDVDRVRKIAKDALENIFLVGVVTQENKTALLEKKDQRVLIRNMRYKIEREPKAKELVDEKEAKRIVQDTLERLIPKGRQTRSAVYNLIKKDVASNTRLNNEETEERRAKAREDAPVIYRRETVKKNELIVEKGKKVTKDDIVKLTQITRVHFIVNRTSYLSGLFMLLIGLVFVAALYLILSEKKIIEKPKRILLIAINAFLAILASLVIIQSQQPGYLIPLAGVGMMLVLLLNVNVAFVTSLMLSIYIGVIAGGKLELTLVLFMGSALGIYAVRGAKKRSQIFFAGFIVSIVNFFCIVGVGFLNNMAKEATFAAGISGIANGIMSSFVVIGLLPVFEYTFNLITNITLLELSDSSNPLLKELTIKAPGTYHHSILVGNLAEEACNSIGANSLLARVGAYYHDIGKTEKAAYFVENESGTPSKHDKLTPSMSALIITNHAKDGIELAKKHKLNDAIIDFIGQHHGTGLIYYFYQRALEKVKSEKELKEEEFRYPGPKPQTKETAIVLLADSVEASSRMLSDPTPARIRGLVQKIINNKFIDGQLDECDLTLRDLHKIAESFVRVLTGVFHVRLEYPEVKTKKERQNALKNKSKQSK